MFAPSRPLSLLYQFAAESPSLVRRGASSVALGGVVKEALEHAKALKKQKQVFHLGKVEELEKQIGSTAPDSSVALAREDGSKLIAAKRRHQLGAFRATAEVESRLRTGETVISIPRFSQMTAQQWASDEGPQLLRLMAKTYGLLGTILPYEVEGRSHVEVSYAGNSAKRGNVVLPSDSLWSPVVSVQSCSKAKLYSCLIVDADVPDEAVGRRMQICLWAKLNVASEDGLLRMMPNDTDAIRCIPPHPARGSDTHRIIAVVLEHEAPIGIEQLVPGIGPGQESASESLDGGVSLPAVLYSQRKMDLRAVVATEGGTKEGEGHGRMIPMIGYNFYRTCWTRTVSDFYTRLGKPAHHNDHDASGTSTPDFVVLLPCRPAHHFHHVRHIHHY